MRLKMRGNMGDVGGLGPGYACGNGGTFGDGTPALKLPTNRPLVYIQDSLPGFDRDSIWSWMKEGFARWGTVCDMKATRIMDMSEAGPNSIVNLVTVADLGGGGILADQMLPYQGGKVLRMRINARISWKATDGPMQPGTIDPVRTLCHEIGHFLGHSHWPVGNPLELMEPTIQQNIISPQPTEGAMSAGWFGPPATTPAPTPPSPGSETIRITMDINRLTGALKQYNGVVTNGIIRPTGGTMDPLNFPNSQQFFDSASKLYKMLTGMTTGTWQEKYYHAWVIAGYAGSLIPSSALPAPMVNGLPTEQMLAEMLGSVTANGNTQSLLTFNWQQLLLLALQFLMEQMTRQQ